MSRWGGGASCPVCGKTVYFAEEVVAEGKKFHKRCFKCSECNKLLDRYFNIKPHFHDNFLLYTLDPQIPTLCYDVL